MRGRNLLLSFGHHALECRRARLSDDLPGTVMPPPNLAKRCIVSRCRLTFWVPEVCSLQLPLDAQVVGYRKDAGNRVGLDSGNILIAFGRHYTF